MSLIKIVNGMASGIVGLAMLAGNVYGQEIKLPGFNCYEIRDNGEIIYSCDKNNSDSIEIAGYKLEKSAIPIFGIVSSMVNDGNPKMSTSNLLERISRFSGNDNIITGEAIKSYARFLVAERGGTIPRITLPALSKK